MPSLVSGFLYKTVVGLVQNLQHNPNLADPNDNPPNPGPISAVLLTRVLSCGNNVVPVHSAFHTNFV